jgi:hypothetical protein
MTFEGESHLNPFPCSKGEVDKGVRTGNGAIASLFPKERLG